jgi:hypothetical protein
VNPYIPKGPIVVRVICKEHGRVLCHVVDARDGAFIYGELYRRIERLPRKEAIETLRSTEDLAQWAQEAVTDHGGRLPTELVGAPVEAWMREEPDEEAHATFRCESCGPKVVDRGAIWSAVLEARRTGMRQPPILI